MATGPADGDSRAEVFFKYICPFTPALSLAFSIALLFALVSVLFALVLPRDSGSFNIALLTIPVDGVVLVVTGYLIRVCNSSRTS